MPLRYAASRAESDSVLLQILERKVDDLAVSDKSVPGSASNTFTIDLPRMRAFQIVTVKLILA